MANNVDPDDTARDEPSPSVSTLFAHVLLLVCWDEGLKAADNESGTILVNGFDSFR